MCKQHNVFTSICWWNCIMLLSWMEVWFVNKEWVRTCGKLPIKSNITQWHTEIHCRVVYNIVEVKLFRSWVRCLLIQHGFGTNVAKTITGKPWCNQVQECAILAKVRFWHKDLIYRYRMWSEMLCFLPAKILLKERSWNFLLLSLRCDPSVGCRKSTSNL